VHNRVADDMHYITHSVNSFPEILKLVAAAAAAIVEISYFMCSTGKV
jgi:hypothetical protein